MKTTEQEVRIKEGRPTRQISVVTARTAFWSSLVTTLLLALLAILVKVTSGLLVIPLVITTIVGLIATLLILLKNRWTMALATLLEALLLGSIWTAPFVVGTLSKPKSVDPVHFFGDALVACSIILAFACSLGTTVQYFRQGSGRTPRWYIIVLNLVIGFTIGTLVIGLISASPAVAGGTTTTNGVPTVHMDTTTFLQPTVTIAKGSKLLLVDDVAVEHDLFNGSWQNGSAHMSKEPGAPTLNDVIVNNNSVTIGPFATAGTYHIFCSIHQGMTLTVIVQ